ncbi:unnamed protein product [Mytilus coruscus]|uniref:B box-type domain-containing protein n=1 Tax=Mytilus coruscus TaxID=42192 RepID=A0A6J8EFC2_MYTCO|nr:unnamed protein product [Mytilus coruscus]
MAFSKSIRRAQVSKLCELCETDTNIKWKCVQCNTLMCEKCKKIDLKVQTAIKHDIVDIKSSEAKTEMDHTNITDNIPSLREQLESEKQRIEKSVTEKEKHVKEVKETLLNKQSNIQVILESNQAAQVFNAYPEFSELEISNASFKAFPEETKDFIPAKENFKTISNLFGSLKRTNLPKGLPQLNLDVIKSYTTDLIAVDRVLIQNDKTAWISYHMTSSLHKINIDETINTVKDISVKVNDMSLTDNNDVLLSLFDSTDISLLTTKTGEIKTFLSVSPLYSLGINVTKNNDIILGVKEEGYPYKTTDKSCRKVIIFGMDGKQKQSYEYYNHKQRLFTILYRITSNVNNDILLIDSISDDDGRVMVLDREGQVKWTYQ